MTDDNIFYVYQYLREDGTPYYIGKGKDNRAFSNGGRPCSKPKDNTYIVVIAENLTENQAFTLEKELIAKYGRKDNKTGILRNKTDGGEGKSGAICSDETREKLRKANTGKILSEETRKRISKSNIGRILSEETRKKISEANKGENNPRYGKPNPNAPKLKGQKNGMYGKHHTEKTLEKLRKANVGKILSEETRAKMSTSAKGKILSEETRAKISCAVKNRKVSQETRLKISAARKLYVLKNQTPIELNPDLFEIIE